MDMIRSFLPVGQGAFFTEQFKSDEETINVIYDCGSSTSVKNINKMISSTFSKSEKIYAVFISHMHSDHMNGLEFLLEYCCVENVFLPYLTPDNVTISIIIQEVSSGKHTDFVKGFVADPENAVNEFCTMHNCNKPRIQYVISPKDEDERLLEIEHRRDRYHSSGVPIYLPRLRCKDGWEKWKYIPYNYENTDRKEEFILELRRNKLDLRNREKILKQLNSPTGRKQIKKAYENITGGLNSNSMVVYSGLANEKHMRSWQDILPNPFLKKCCNDCWCRTTSGCLYTGDFDAHSAKNFEALINNYEYLRNEIGTIQLPHHGSEDNFNVDLLTTGDFFIISAGYKNRYKHPHVKVLKELALHRCLYAWVTEDVGSIVQFLITIRRC